MKSLENTIDFDALLQKSTKEYEERQAETKKRIDSVRKEIDKWRYPNNLKVVLSSKYR